MMIICIMRDGSTKTAKSVARLRILADQEGGILAAHVVECRRQAYVVPDSPFWATVSPGHSETYEDEEYMIANTVVGYHTR